MPSFHALRGAVLPTASQVHTQVAQPTYLPYSFLDVLRRATRHGNTTSCSPAALIVAELLLKKAGSCNWNPILGNQNTSSYAREISRSPVPNH